MFNIKHLLFIKKITLYITSILIILLLPHTSSFAQGAWTVQLDFTETPPSDIYLWESRGASLGSISITSGSTTATDIQIFMTISEGNRGEVASVNGDIITILPGEILDLGIGSDLNYNNAIINSDFDAVIARTALLPGGNYVICIDVQDVNTSTSLGIGCSQFTIDHPIPPILYSPNAETDVTEAVPIFEWQVSAPTNAGITYTILVVEVTDGSPSNSIDNNLFPNIHETGIPTSDGEIFIYYENFAPLVDFEQDKTYAWRVQALYSNGIPAGINDGKSEIFTFKYIYPQIYPPDEGFPTAVLMGRILGGEGTYVYYKKVTDGGTDSNGETIWTPQEGTVDSQLIVPFNFDISHSGTPVTYEGNFSFDDIEPNTSFELKVKGDTAVLGNTFYGSMTSGRAFGNEDINDGVDTTIEYGLRVRQYIDDVKIILRDSFKHLALNNNPNSTLKIDYIITDKTFSFNNEIYRYILPPSQTCTATGTIEYLYYSTYTLSQKVVGGFNANFIIDVPGYKQLQDTAKVRSYEFSDRKYFYIKPRPIVIKGFTMAKEGEPLPNVPISIGRSYTFNGGSAYASFDAVSNSLGYFEIPIEFPDYMGSFISADLTVQMSDPRELAPDKNFNINPLVPGDTIDYSKILFTPFEGTLNGTVTSTDGQPVDSAIISVLRYKLNADNQIFDIEQMDKINFITYTDINGQYTCQIPINSESEQYVALIEHPDFEDKHSLVDTVKKDIPVTLDFVLDLDFPMISGTVENTGEASLIGAKVKLLFTTNNSPDSLFRIIDAKGFEFADSLQPGSYSVIASFDGFNDDTASYDLSYGDKKSKNFVLKTPTDFGSIIITVFDSTDSEENPVNGVKINSDDALPATKFTQWTSTDLDNELIKDGIRAGDITLDFVHDNYLPISLDVTIVKDSTIDIKMILTKAQGTLLVTVFGGGNRVQGCDVILKDDTIKTNNLGQVTFTGLSLAEQTIMVNPPDPNPQMYGSISGNKTIANGLNALDINLQPGAQISGVVTDTGGTFLDSVNVSVKGSEKLFTVLTDSQGRYTITGIPPSVAGDKFTLSASKSGYIAKDLSKSWSLNAGAVNTAANFELTTASLTKLFGFEISIETEIALSGGGKKISGAIIDIKPNFPGLSFAKEGQQLQFKDVELDKDNNPITNSINLVTTEADIKMLDMDGKFTSSGGLLLELVAKSDTPPEVTTDDTEGTTPTDTDVTMHLDSVGRITGMIFLEDISKLTSGIIPEMPNTSLIIPQSYAPSFWADGVNRGLEKYGITATDSSVAIQVRQFAVSVNYQETKLDTAGFHFHGSIAYKDKKTNEDKYALAFAPILIGKNSEGNIRVKEITVSPTPNIINLGAFKVHCNTISLNPDGMIMKGKLELHRLAKPREFGFENLRISSKGEFVSMKLTAEGENGVISAHGQKFTLKELEYGTENYDDDEVENVHYLAFTGEMEITKLDEPVFFENIKYTENDDFTGTIKAEQSVTFGGVVRVDLGELTFDKDEEMGKYISVTGGIKFGAINGISAKAGNLRFFHDGTVTVDEVGIGFIAGPTEVDFLVHWTKDSFGGTGFIRVLPKITAGAKFHYGGEDDWGVQITSGTRIPIGGALEIIDATGGVEYSNETWKFLIGGTFAPKNSAKGVNLDSQVEVYLNAKNEVIIVGSGVVKVGGSQEIGSATFTLDVQNDKLDGSILMVYEKSGMKAQAQIDIGIHFGNYWYVYGQPEVDFFGFFKANGHIIFAENWTWVHEGVERKMNGIHAELSSPYSYNDNWAGIIKYGITLDQRASVDISWSGENISGSVLLDGSAWAGLGIDAGFFEVNLIEAGANIKLTANLKKTVSELTANGRGTFGLWGKIGDCDEECPGGICYFSGAVACINMSAGVDYSSSAGLNFDVSF